MLKKLPWFQGLRRRLSRQWKVSIALFRGQKCTLMPFRIPITVVLGRPLQVRFALSVLRHAVCAVSNCHSFLSTVYVELKVPKVAEDAITPALVSAYLEKYLVRTLHVPPWWTSSMSHSWPRPTHCIMNNSSFVSCGFWCRLSFAKFLRKINTATPPAKNVNSNWSSMLWPCPTHSRRLVMLMCTSVSFDYYDKLINFISRSRTSKF